MYTAQSHWLALSSLAHAALVVPDGRVLAEPDGRSEGALDGLELGVISTDGDALVAGVEGTALDGAGPAVLDGRRNKNQASRPSTSTPATMPMISGAWLRPPPEPPLGAPEGGAPKPPPGGPYCPPPGFGPY